MKWRRSSRIAAGPVLFFSFPVLSRFVDSVSTEQYSSSESASHRRSFGVVDRLPIYCHSQGTLRLTLFHYLPITILSYCTYNTVSPDCRFSFYSLTSLSCSSSSASIMFTGLIEDIGVVTAIRIDPTTHQTILTIRTSSPHLLSDCQLGDSIAINGCCLTVTSFDRTTRTFTVGLSPETLRRTTFATLTPSTAVNLERSLTPTSRVGGHYVQGHVDGVGRVRVLQKDGDALRVVIACGGEILQYVVEKGYIAIDGTSLTVTRVDEQRGELEVMLIQYTQSKITLPKKQLGEGVNLEADIMGKQIVAYLAKVQQVHTSKTLMHQSDFSAYVYQ